MQINRDARTKMVAKLIRAGEIQKFQDIFGLEIGFPRSVLAKHLRTNNNRMRSIVQRPGDHLTLLEIKRIADYFEVSYELMLLLINRQVFPFVKFAADK